ncbi:MAG: hypothetical protein ACREEK_30185 [Bradyrhizobium sp.]
MADPIEEKERRKYLLQKMMNQWVRGRRWAFWLPVAFFCGMGLLVAIFGKH